MVLNRKAAWYPGAFGDLQVHLELPQLGVGGATAGTSK